MGNIYEVLIWEQNEETGFFEFSFLYYGDSFFTAFFVLFYNKLIKRANYIKLEWR